MDPQLDQIIESLLFASAEPIESKSIARLIRRVAKRQAAAEAEAASEEADAELGDEDEQDMDSSNAVDEEPAAVNADEDADEDEDEDEDEDDEQGEGKNGTEPGEAVNLARLRATEIDKAIANLNTYYENTGRAFAIVARTNGWKLYSRPEFSPWLRELFPIRRSARLSPPALETLAIIAYRQPLTRAAIEAVRGVAVDGVVHTLIERGLIQIAGRAELPGRPLLYETTPLFFEHFNIRNIDDLPNAAELRQVKLPEPEIAELAGEDDDFANESEEQEEFDLADRGAETATDDESGGRVPEVEQLEIPQAEEE